MNQIVYYVAVSIDGFIAGLNEDISGFVAEGDGVDQYKADLLQFATIIMGRKTYEFGYKYGLKPGQPAYPHMKHYIFSNSLRFEDCHEKVEVKPLEISEIENIKNESLSDIYLCGGGDFAGWLLDHEKIDILKLKLNPLILGQGVNLFGSSTKNYQLVLTEEAKAYEGGMQMMTYRIQYSS